MDCVHQSPAVTNEEQERLVLLCRLRLAEKNRLVKKVLLEKEGQKRTAVKREEKNNMRKVMVSLMVTYDGTISGPNGARHVLPVTGNTIGMRWNGGNRR